MSAEEERKKHFRGRATFWFDTFKMLFCTTKHVGHETLEDEWYIVIKAYMFTVLECPRYPYICSLYQVCDTNCSEQLHIILTHSF